MAMKDVRHHKDWADKLGLTTRKVGKALRHIKVLIGELLIFVLFVWKAAALLHVAQIPHQPSAKIELRDCHAEKPLDRQTLSLTL